MLKKDCTSSKVSDKKRTSLLLLTFISKPEKNFEWATFQEAYRYQSIKCKTWSARFMQHRFCDLLRKKKVKKKTRTNYSPLSAKGTNLLTTCTCAVMVFGWNVNLFCYVASWRCVSKLTNKKLKRRPQQWWHLSEPTLTQNKDCCHFWNVCNSPIQ